MQVPASLLLDSPPQPPTVSQQKCRILYLGQRIHSRVLDLLSFILLEMKKTFYKCHFHLKNNQNPKKFSQYFLLVLTTEKRILIFSSSTSSLLIYFTFTNLNSTLDIKIDLAEIFLLIGPLFYRNHPASICGKVPVLRPMDLMVEATPRRVFANAHTYHINSISVNSDYETYMSADDLRINLWNFEITNQSFNIVDIKPANMEELTEVITAAEFHPHHCNSFVYSSSKGTIRLCDMRASALCDRHSKFFEEPEDPSNRSFFSEIISSISDVKFSHSGRYIMTRDYLTVKVWDLNMENRPIETYQVHDYLRSKLCSLYENDCIFDKFECVWNGSDSVIMTGSYNNFFRMFDRNTKRDVTLEASRENSKPRAILKPRKVCVGGKRRKDEISVDSLDFSKKILHTAWHPSENIIAVAATNNLYIFQDKVN
uniref:Serine/threonine-protein phosphatase 2A 55 kDa regulatory subunit B n=1 Tax=Canis lupus familiaris TaxID=9615 RepID=A0A8C0RCW2_CANLF